jgi:molecular chaperone GrpE
MSDEKREVTEETSVTIDRAEYEALKERAEERDRLFQQLQRTAADFENYQKRVKRDRPQWEQERVKRFLRDLLPALDDLGRLIGAVEEGGIPAEEVRTVLGLLKEKVGKIFADWSIEGIPAEGEAFDPRLHEALRQEVTDRVDPGRIVEELRPGYTVDGSVLRAAQVVVAQAPPESEPTDAGGEGEQKE